MYCQKCGKPMKENSEECPFCGHENGMDASAVLREERSIPPSDIAVYVVMALIIIVCIVIAIHFIAAAVRLSGLKDALDAESVLRAEFHDEVEKNLVIGGSSLAFGIALGIANLISWINSK